MISLFTYHLEEDCTLDELLKVKWKIGKKLTHSLRMSQSFTIDDEKANFHTIYPKGSRLICSISLDHPSYKPSDHPVPIIWEDQHLCIAYKEKGLKVHPNEPEEQDTLMNRIVNYMRTTHQSNYAEHVHRLDQGTDGLVLIAKHPISKRILDQMIEQHQIERLYLATVEGSLFKKQGTIRKNIGNDRHVNHKKTISTNGQTAITHYKLLDKPTSNTSRLQLKLETGRTHQIRVHLASMGHPIVGDHLYGSTTRQNEYELTANQLLFTHPITKQVLNIQYTDSQISDI